MNIIKYFIATSVMCGILFAGALPAKAKLTPCTKSTGDEIKITHGHPYLGGSRSPGDSIGMTALEYQANGGCEKRIYVDDSFQVHVTWMKVPFPFTSMAQRRMEYNFRYSDGTWLGEIDATPFSSGYGSLDMTRISPQRPVISFHYSFGPNEYYPCISIAGDIHYAPYHNWLWPIVTCVNNGNIVMATDDYDGNYHHVLLTTDEGDTWTNVFNTDSAVCISQYVISSNHPGSNKVAFVETRFITDSAATGQLDNNVWFRLSTDGGVTWGPHINVTSYQPGDSVRAYCNVSALFDNNDNLHIVWAGRYIWHGNYYDASKIFHWDEVHNQISLVSWPTGIFSGGWWGWTNPNGYGTWRMPADQPQLSVDYMDGSLYCIWCGQNDTADFSLGGYPNGDIYGASSYDGGLIWSNWTNITNTHTPGASAGACEDEDYITINPVTYGRSSSYPYWPICYLSYIEDKDAGAITQNEGDTTDNPVRVFLMPSGIEESNAGERGLSIVVKPIPARNSTQIIYTIPASQVVNVRLYGIDGRLVNLIDQGEKSAGNYSIRIDARELTSGTYFVVLETQEKRMTEKIVVVR